MHFPLRHLRHPHRGRPAGPDGQPRHAPFTASEVRQRLRQSAETSPRTAAVHAAASDVSAWTALLGPRTAYALGRTAERLPTVVFWYSRGRRLDEIGRGLAPFGSTWDGDQAVDVASQLIAYLLNRRPAAYARGSGRAGAVG